MACPWRQGDRPAGCCGTRTLLVSPRSRDGRTSRVPGGDQAMAKLTPPAPVTFEDFDKVFEAVRNWGRWGSDDELGTLNYITQDTVRAAAALVRSGRRAT